MATTIQGINGSIVDFLNSRGVTSGMDKVQNFDYRKKLYTQLGGADDFVGSADQNTALLNKLMNAEKSAGVTINPNNWNTVLQTIQTPTFVDRSLAPVDATPLVDKSLPESGSEAYTLLEQIYGKQLTPEELSRKALEEATSGPVYELRKEKMEADKAALELKNQRDKEKLLADLGSRGLFFSGKRQTGLDQIDADTIAKKLGVDRSFALLIAGGLETAAQNIAKEAAKGNQDAITALEKLGYIVNPLTGKLEPSLAAKNAMASAQSRKEASLRAEKQLALSEARFNRLMSNQNDIYVPNIPGLSKSQARDIYTSAEPPQWFIENGGHQKTVGLYPEIVQGKWQDYQTQMQSLYAKQEPEPSKWQAEAAIWQWLAGDGAMLSDDEKSLQIQAEGFDPESFGLMVYEAPTQ